MPTLRGHLRLAILVLLTCLILSPAVLLATEALQTPLPMDPAVHVGRLDNGVAYWVRSHATPPGKTTFWMHVATGSLHEADGQEGIAHYLEHMAFNGTQHFPPGELLAYFEAIGLRFGQHQNAFTGFNQTTYLITLPDTKPDTIDKGLLFLADVAFRMLLTSEEIDKERNVVLEEKRASKGVGQRLTEKLLPSILPGSRVARRLPIGLEASLKQLQQPDFLAYYTTWYHPAKVTILAVGDVPVDTMVNAITTHFAPWQRDTPPPADPDHGIVPSTQQRAIIVTDPELTTASVEMLGVQPRTPVHTLADLRQRVVINLGTWIINRRLQQLIQEGKASYQRAHVHRSGMFGTAEQFSAEADAEPTQWDVALRGLLHEIQRALRHGFTEQELADAQRATLTAAEHAAQTEATRDAHGFLRAMNRAVTNGERVRSAAQNLALLQQLVPGVRLAEVNNTFATHFEPSQKAYVVTLPEKADLPVPSQDTVLALVRDALAMPVEPWQVAARPTSLLAQVPQPGTVHERSRFAPLDVTHVTFANNVRVHYRFTDFKKEHVTVAMTLPGGKIREQAANRGITSLATMALSRPATGQFSSTDIRDFMTGKKVWVQGDMTEDAITLHVSGAPEAIEDGLQLAHLVLQDAKIEAPSVARWKTQQLQDLEAFRTRINARVQDAADRLLSGSDPRRTRITPEQVEARAGALPEAQLWLNTILRTAPLEVAIVGDIPEDRAMQLAATYLGSLPTRPRHDPSIMPLRQVPGFTGPVTQSLEVDTITPRARLTMMWQCADWQDVRGRRLVHLIARILERRLREEIREERGLTYSTNVYARSSKIYPNMSALHVEFSTDPDKVSDAVQAARSVVETFAAAGPTPEEIDIVRKQFKNSLDMMLKRPQFWVGLLSDLEYHGTRLEDIHGLLDQIMAFTQADIAAEAAKIVTPERFAMVIGRPKLPATSQQSSPAAPTAGAPQQPGIGTTP